MKKGYWVVAYRSVSSESALREYAKLAGPVVTAAGGRVLLRTADVRTAEAGLKERTTVVEFESLAVAVSTHDSAAYQDAVRALGAGAERDFRIVEGLD